MNPAQETRADIMALVEWLPAEVKAAIIAKHEHEQSLRRSQMMREIHRRRKVRESTLKVAG